LPAPPSSHQRVADRSREPDRPAVRHADVAISDAALRLERASRADNILELVREQIEMIPATAPASSKTRSAPP